MPTATFRTGPWDDFDATMSCCESLQELKTSVLNRLKDKIVPMLPGVLERLGAFGERLGAFWGVLGRSGTGVLERPGAFGKASRGVPEPSGARPERPGAFRGAPERRLAGLIGLASWAG